MLLTRRKIIPNHTGLMYTLGYNKCRIITLSCAGYAVYTSVAAAMCNRSICDYALWFLACNEGVKYMYCDYCRMCIRRRRKISRDHFDIIRNILKGLQQ